MTAPKQPDLQSNNYANIEPIQRHRKAVLDYAREHEGEWVTYWDSPSKASARSVKQGLKIYTVGSDPLMDKDYVMHGRNSDEGWSIRLEGLATQVRFNGILQVGDSPDPSRRLPKISEMD